ncbi:MAG TPA: NAD kinase [Bacteroidia bacterium]|nr:NAD kinase [Bacteroidia bacterium]
MNSASAPHFALYGRPGSVNIVPYLEILLKEIALTGGTAVIHHPFYTYLKHHTSLTLPQNTFSTHEELRGKVDFLVSLGGDGTLLDTITLVRDSGIPIVGVNTGRLGFLAGISKDDINQVVDALVKGRFHLDSRSLIRLETSSPLFGEVNYALNEITIHKKDSSSMIIIHTYLNGEYLNSYWADGLIIATPTGSTGYSLSCGGPIIVPQSENFVITPIAPHNLNVRPIVVSDKGVISLEVEGRSQYFLASLDSRSVTIDSSVQLAARKEDFKANIVRLDNDNYLSTLRNKLMWGLDVRN